MSAPTVLIVDDEPLARETLRALVAADPDVTLSGSSGDGEDARRRILAERPDIVLLDIEMPGLRGVDLLASLPEAARPAVVFVTAYDAFAVRAFELEAVDYLLKPFSDARFAEVMARAKRSVLSRRMTSLARDLAGTDGGAPPIAAAPVGNAAERPTPAASPRYLERIPIKRHGRQLLVSVDDVRWIESDDYCVRVHTRDSRFLVRGTLQALETRLDPAVFVRVHRGAIVRVAAVEEIVHRSPGRRQLKLDTGALVPVARARAKAVVARLAPLIDG